MAVQGQKREGFRLFTGLCDVDVVGINPSIDELKLILNREDVKLTDYVSTTESGARRLRVDFYVKNIRNAITTKVPIWLEDKLMQSQDGTMKQYINNVGITCWIKDNEEAPVWFKGPYRQAYLGEEILYRFISAWTNIDPKKEGSQIILDTPFEELLEGNVSELRDLIDSFGDQQIRVLLSVKDGKFQDVYGKVFLPAGSTYVKKLQSVLADDKKRGYPYKSNYQGSFAFQEFTGVVAPETDVTQEEVLDPEEALRRLQEEAN